MFEVLNNIRIVLVNTSHPGNIGAAARAMKTMGLTRLYLVEPLQYPCAEATARASGADDLLAGAVVCNSLADAVGECMLVIGTSARERRLEWPSLLPDEAAGQLLREASRGEVALVFGRERFGLTNEELDACHFLVNIPANPDYSSLNLAAAVQILCYELRRHCGGPEAGPQSAAEENTPATAGEVEGFYGHLEETLYDIGLMEAGEPKQSLLRRLRRLFQRTRLTRTEVNILRGILTATQKRGRNPRNT